MTVNDSDSPARVGDIKLIQQASAGSGEAFDALFGPLIEGAYRLALVLLRDLAEAEDAVQEAALRAWRKLPQLREATQIQAWFFAIVANQCRTIRRGRWWLTVRLPTPPERAVRMEEGAIRGVDMAGAFRRLSPEDRLALHLFFYVDLPLTEAATAMGVSVPAARSRIYRALKRLRPELKLHEEAL